MTRAGTGYVAMAAAGISAAALGFAVIWSYGEPDTPPVVMAAPPMPQNAPPPVAVAPVQSSQDAVIPAAPDTSRSARAAATAPSP